MKKATRRKRLPRRDPVYRKPGETLTQFAQRHYAQKNLSRSLLDADEDAEYKETKQGWLQQFFP